MTNPTSPDTSQSHPTVPPIEDLVRLVACYANRDQVEAAGFSFGTDLKLGPTPNPNIAGDRSYTHAHFLHYARVVNPGTYR